MGATQACTSKIGGVCLSSPVSTNQVQERGQDMAAAPAALLTPCWAPSRLTGKCSQDPIWSWCRLIPWAQLVEGPGRGILCPARPASLTKNHTGLSLWVEPAACGRSELCTSPKRHGMESGTRQRKGLTSYSHEDFNIYSHKT